MTLKEIAHQLGVSASSISIVRKGKPGVSAATRRSIQLMLEQNGYSYDVYAQDSYERVRSPRGKEDHAICLLKHVRNALLTDNNEGFVAGLIDPLTVAIATEGYTLEINTINSEEYPDFLRTLSDDQFAGMLVIATEMSQDELCQLSQVRIPTVVLDTDHPFIPHSSVTMNNRQLAWQAVAGMASRGCVGYLKSSQMTGNFAARSVGYREALAAFSLPSDPALVFDVTPSLDGAEKDMERLLNEKRPVPPALFADNDIIAIGCMRALLRHGVRIPEDTQLVGVDDTLLSRVINPSLSSMQISRTQMASQAVKLLMETIADPSRLTSRIHIDARLIYRRSLE